MWEVPHNLTKQWAQVDKQNIYAPQHIDVECPNPECRRSLVNLQLKWAPAWGLLIASPACGKCKNNAYFFLIDPPKSSDIKAKKTARLFQFPKPAMQTLLEEGIADISPAFVEIHTQAQEAEALELSSLVGIGYRKALEHLIKDYIIDKDQSLSDQVAKMPLSQCINNYVSDPNIKSCAERAVWLGNDETHYVRKWPDHDIEDLKRLLQLTRYWITSELLTEKYKRKMQHSGEGKLAISTIASD